jgi:hypothetical protein
LILAQFGSIRSLDYLLKKTYIKTFSGHLWWPKTTNQGKSLVSLQGSGVNMFFPLYVKAGVFGWQPLNLSERFRDPQGILQPSKCEKYHVKTLIFAMFYAMQVNFFFVSNLATLF